MISLRGYEHYVIDGKRICTKQKHFEIGRFFRKLIYQFFQWNTKLIFLFTGIFADVGYVRNFDEMNNPLNNRISQGFKMDVVIIIGLEAETYMGKQVSLF